VLLIWQHRRHPGPALPSQGTARAWSMLISVFWRRPFDGRRKVKLHPAPLECGYLSVLSPRICAGFRPSGRSRSSTPLKADTIFASEAAEISANLHELVTPERQRHFVQLHRDFRLGRGQWSPVNSRKPFQVKHFQVGGGERRPGSSGAECSCPLDQTRPCKLDRSKQA
jgi:hypothetical protein